MTFSPEVAPLSMTAMQDDERSSQILTVATTVLQQAVDMLDAHITSDDQLVAHSALIPGSTLGKHMRHALDHFTLLLDSITSPPPYEFSYDTRKRNVPMETSKSAARQTLLDGIARLQDVVPKVNMDESMTLNAITPFLHSYQTTFGRELWFACLHCVHHWAQVRVIVGEQGIKLADDFGFAPSTLVYQDREAPLGKSKI